MFVCFLPEILVMSAKRVFRSELFPFPIPLSMMTARTKTTTLTMITIVVINNINNNNNHNNNNDNNDNNDFVHT